MVCCEGETSVDERVAVQRDGQGDGIREGDVYDVREGGKWWPARLACGELGWYLIAEDGRRCWPLVSLWRWQALGQGKHWEGVVNERVCGDVVCVGMAAPLAWELIEQLMVGNAVLIDIRYAARSRWFPQWNKSWLLKRWGTRYTHERGLSNANYRDKEQPVTLVNPGPAVEGAVELLTKGYGLVLLCACDGEQMACHCREVVRLIEERLQQVMPDSSPVAWVRRVIGGGRVGRASGGQASLGA